MYVHNIPHTSKFQSWGPYPPVSTTTSIYIQYVLTLKTSERSNFQNAPLPAGIFFRSSCSFLCSAYLVTLKTSHLNSAALISYRTTQTKAFTKVLKIMKTHFKWNAHSFEHFAPKKVHIFMKRWTTSNQDLGPSGISQRDFSSLVAYLSCQKYIGQRAAADS